MAVGKADIELLFGALGGGKISGASGQLIKSQLDSLVASLNNDTNSKKRRIRLNLDINNTKSAFTQGLKQITETLSGQKQFNLKVSQIDATAAISDFRDKLNAMLKTLRIDTGFNVSVGTDGATSAVKEIAEGAKEATLSLAQVEARLKEINVTGRGITSDYGKVYKELGGDAATGEDATKVQELRNKYTELQDAIENLRMNRKQATEEEVQSIHTLQGEIEGLINKYKESTEASREANDTDRLKQVISLHDKLNKYLLKNTRGKGTESYQTLTAMKVELDQVLAGTKELNEIDLSRLQNEFTEAEGKIKGAGKEGKSLGGIISAAYEKFGGWMLVTRSMAAAIRQIKQMVTHVIEIDTAMTELKKVTNETDETYEKFLKNASSRAKELGATITDTVSATADFARLGYSIEDASTLADVALLYKNVGDGITDVNMASEHVLILLIH